MADKLQSAEVVRHSRVLEVLGDLSEVPVSDGDPSALEVLQLVELRRIAKALEVIAAATQRSS